MANWNFQNDLDIEQDVPSLFLFSPDFSVDLKKAAEVPVWHDEMSEEPRENDIQSKSCI